MATKVIESKTKSVPGHRSCFEQRAVNEQEQAIYYFNQPVIKFPITDENKTVVQKIIEDMHGSMNGCGIGLAHNQYPQQENATNPYSIFIIEAKDVERYKGVLHVPFEAFINPIIVGHTTEKVGFYHGCLSAIGTDRAEVSTYKEILIAFFSEDLELQVKKYTEMAAIICQHEFNHLATRGTYVDTVNNYVNGDRFINAAGYYLTDKAIEKFFRDRGIEGGIIDPVGDNVPCLINEEVLARCKKALVDDEKYRSAVDRYLNNHPEDRGLYSNLMSHSDTDIPLYFQPTEYDQY